MKGKGNMRLPRVIRRRERPSSNRTRTEPNKTHLLRRRANKLFASVKNHVGELALRRLLHLYAAVLSIDLAAAAGVVCLLLLESFGERRKVIVVLEVFRRGLHDALQLEENKRKFALEKLRHVEDAYT